ncbi:MAG: hypothetical protein K0R29_2730 [Pseudobdellovibrio sp.]|jgi:hypothetical protein|nr:hypothetical protein [Pseudobdellovibrio sp.]
MKYLLLLLLCGCATQPLKTLSDYKFVDPKMIEKYQSTESEANVVITRDSGFTGSAFNTWFYVNGEKVLSIGPSQKAYLKLPLGPSVFGLCVPATPCKIPDLESETQILPGLNVYRVSISTQMLMSISKTTLIK